MSWNIFESAYSAGMTLFSELGFNLLQPLFSAWFTVPIHTENEDVDHSIVFVHDLPKAVGFQHFVDAA